MLLAIRRSPGLCAAAYGLFTALPVLAHGGQQTNTGAGTQPAEATARRTVSTSLSVGKTFTPTTILIGDAATGDEDVSTLTITLANASGMPATLNATFSDALPTHLTLANPANAATTCANGSVTASPGGNTIVLGVGAEIPATGNCTVTASVTADTVGTWINLIPAGALQTDLGDNASPASAALTVQQATLDPYYKYPPIVLPLISGGTFSYHSGPAIHVLVAAPDPAIPGKQIFFTSMESNASLYGVDGRDGSPLPGFWPAPHPLDRGGVVYPFGIVTLPAADGGTTLPALPHYDLMAGHWNGAMQLFDGSGETLWELDDVVNFIATPGASYGAIGPTDADDARFVQDEESFDVQCRSGLTGQIIWQADHGVSQEIHTPTIVDPDSDDASFVFATGTVNEQCEVQRYRVADGSQVWTHRFSSCGADTFVASGDVDGQPGDEVVAVVRVESAPFDGLVVVLDAATGDVLWQYDLGESGESTAPALADLDGDGIAEIIVQGGVELHVLKYGQGEMLGWPVTICPPSFNCARGNSAPVIGDLDGDPDMEIAVTNWQGGSAEMGYLNIFDQHGQRKFFRGPVAMPIADGRVPAIADVDNDGHNELLVGSVAGSDSAHPSLYVFDFSRDHPEIQHGPILWGQFGGNPQHTNRAVAIAPAIGFDPTTVTESALAGTATTATLRLGNTGVLDLTWSLEVQGDCANPAPVSWLSASPANGNNRPGAATPIVITLDATALVAGAYRANLCVQSNDPHNGTLAVPVQLTVMPSDVVFADGFDPSGP